MFELTWESKTLTLWPQLVQYLCLTIFCQSTSMGVHVKHETAAHDTGKTRKFAELCEGNRWKATDASPWELCFAVRRPPTCRLFVHATDQFQAYAPGMSQRSAYAPPVSLPLRHVDLQKPDFCDAQHLEVNPLEAGFYHGLPTLEVVGTPFSLTSPSITGAAASCSSRWKSSALKTYGWPGAHHLGTVLDVRSRSTASFAMALLRHASY